MVSLLGTLSVIQVINYSEAPPETSTENLVISGGVTFDHSEISASRDESLSRFLINVDAESNLEKFIGEGAMLHAGLAVQRGQGAQFLEDNQIFSNIDADDITKLYEVFLEQSVTKNGTLKVGRQDANSDFSVPKYTGQFLNSSMGFSPTIALPSYPTPVLSVTWLQTFSDEISGSFGIFDSVNSVSSFQEQFVIGQLNYDFDWGLSFNIGYWHDTAAEHQDFYFIGEYQFDNSQSVSVQYGKGEERVTGFSSHFGMTYQTNALFNADDFFGMGLTKVTIGQSSEDVVEIYYGHSFGESLLVQLDLQHISTAGLIKEQEGAVVSTLRLQLSF